MFVRATEKNSQGPCPFRAEGICTGDDCVMWNDEVNACGLSPNSLQLLMKTAVADASGARTLPCDAQNRWRYRL